MKFNKNFLCKRQCQNKKMSHKLGKTFAKDTSDKGLLSKLYKKPLEFNNKKRNNLLKIWAEDLNRYLTKKDD